MRRIDLTGQAFGRWTVVSYAGNKRWECLCECGRRKAVHASNLKSGASRSCGCLSVEISQAHFTKHGAALAKKVTPEYRAWQGMKDRCLNPNSEFYDRYGGRGITVHEGWVKDFSAFLDHVGARPSPAHSLDRIEVNGNYEPGNVRWATDVQQNRNRRNVPVIDGKDVVQIRLERGISKTTYYRRLRLGWDKGRAATEAPRPKRPNGSGRATQKPASQQAP